MKNYHLETTKNRLAFTYQLQNTLKTRQQCSRNHLQHLNIMLILLSVLSVTKCIAHFTLISLFFLPYICSCVVLLLYNSYFLFSALSTERTWFDYISILVIPCIIYYVTNKETLNLEPWTLRTCQTNKHCVVNTVLLMWRATRRYYTLVSIWCSKAPWSMSVPSVRACVCMCALARVCVCVCVYALVCMCVCVCVSAVLNLL